MPSTPARAHPPSSERVATNIKSWQDLRCENESAIGQVIKHEGNNKTVMPHRRIIRESIGRLYLPNITSNYGSSCANNGKDALNTPECAVTLYYYMLYLYLGEWNPRVWNMSE
eukprot:2015800-Pyramimonas_sp.AAC.1